MSDPSRLVVESSEAPATMSAVNQFEDFFLRKRAELYSGLCLVTRNRHEAEDLTQEAFVRVMERWDRVQHDGGPAPVPLQDGDGTGSGVATAEQCSRRSGRSARPGQTTRWLPWTSVTQPFWFLRRSPPVSEQRSF